MGLLAAASFATAQEEKSAELKVLDHFVGTWDINGFYKPAGGEKIPFQTVSHRKWSTRGTTIYFDDPGSGPDDPGVQILLTYDPEKKSYPGVTMAGPARGEITGTWDDKTKTMSFTGTLAGGAGTLEANHRFVDADNADPKGVFKNPDGEVIAELSWKQTRRKPLGNVPTVEQLIASYHKAIGGLEANKKITTRQFKGTISFVGAPDPFKMTVVQKAPNLSYAKVEIPGLGTALEGHDGKVAWKSNEAEGTVELEGEERVQKLRDYQFYKYLDLKSDFKEVVSKGRETLKGKSYDVLAIAREDGSGETLYFDARTHMLEVIKRPELTLEMSDYVKIDGIPYQRTMTVSAPDGTAMMTIKFGTIKHGGEVDDSLFARPK